MQRFVHYFTWDSVWYAVGGVILSFFQPLWSYLLMAYFAVLIEFIARRIAKRYIPEHKETWVEQQRDYIWSFHKIVLYFSALAFAAFLQNGHKIPFDVNLINIISGAIIGFEARFVFKHIQIVTGLDLFSELKKYTKKDAKK